MERYIVILDSESQYCKTPQNVKFNVIPIKTPNKFFLYNLTNWLQDLYENTKSKFQPRHFWDRKMRWEKITGSTGYQDLL